MKSNSEVFQLVHSYSKNTKPLEFKSILESLAKNAQQNGSDPFITQVNNDGTNQLVTYKEFEELSFQACNWIEQNSTNNEKDIIAILPKNNIASVAIIIGALRLGHVLLILDSNKPKERLYEQVISTKANLVIQTESYPEKVSQNAITFCLEDIKKCKGDKKPIIQLREYDEAFYFATSGSTATSKIVIQSHLNIVSNAKAMQKKHNLKKGVKLLGCLPIYHVNGLHLTIFATLYSGSHAILCENFSSLSYIKTFQEFKPDIASVVPNILETLLVIWKKPSIHPKFKYFISAAAALSKSVVNDLNQKFNIKVHQGYGLSETTNFSTTIPSSITSNSYRAFILDPPIPSIGTPVYENTVEIIDTNGNILPENEKGELCIRGKNVMIGYLDLEQSEIAFKDGWFHTGDLGYKLKDKETNKYYFFLTGRIKNIAKIRGENVSLEEMERELLKFDKILDAVCIPFTKKIVGEELVVVYSSVDEYSLTANDLNNQLKKKFSASVIPKKMVKLKEIPKTSTGKILRAKLKKQIADIAN